MHRKLNMSPCSAIEYVINGLRINIKHFTERSPAVLFAKLLYLPDLLGGKFCVGRSLPYCNAFRVLPRGTKFSRWASTFAGHVGHIFLVSRQEKVIRPNARPVVAAVAYAQAAGDFTHANHIRDSVGEGHAIPIPKAPVSIGELPGQPDPARPNAGNVLRLGTVLIDFLPEALKSFWRHLHPELLDFFEGQPLAALSFFRALVHGGTLGAFLEQIN